MDSSPGAILGLLGLVFWDPSQVSESALSVNLSVGGCGEEPMVLTGTCPRPTYTIGPVHLRIQIQRDKRSYLC